MRSVLGPCLAPADVASTSEPIRFRWFFAYAATVISAAYVAVLVPYGRFVLAVFPLPPMDGFVPLEVITLWLSAPAAYALGRVCGDRPKRSVPGLASASISVSAAGLLGTALFLWGLGGGPSLREAGPQMFQTASGWVLPGLGAPLLAGLLLCGLVRHRGIGVQRTVVIASGLLIGLSAMAVAWFGGAAFGAALVPLAVWCVAVAIRR